MPISKGIFTLFNPDEFMNYLDQSVFTRNITLIQNHHTYKPDYNSFKGDNAFAMLESMRNYHVNHNHWSEIGQNITTFPNGTIAICRPINISPAGIKGANSTGICIEHVGNFDKDGDAMNDEHMHAILFVNAAFCKRFNLKPDINSIVYHHWYDLNTGKRTNGSGVTKSCPGTNFFTGNTLECAEKEFIPRVNELLKEINKGSSVNGGIMNKGMVIAESLRVRDTSSISGKILRVLKKDTNVDIYFELNGWYKISNNANEWVAKDFVKIMS
jgi:hypothetical protein